MNNLSYERAVEEHENERLTYYTQRSNFYKDHEDENKLFMNLSIKQLFQGISKTFISIINEIVSGEVKSLRQLIVTMFRADRMIYVGVLLVMIAFAIYIMDIAS